MASYIATVAADSGNWDLCKESRLWGFGRNSVGAGSEVRPGDVVYVWQSEKGLKAKAMVTTSGVLVGPSAQLPWPEKGKYFGIFGIHVISELSVPVGDTFGGGSGGTTGVHLGLRKDQLQRGFSRLSPEVASVLEAEFLR